ncbi:hypothetical protein HY29_14095 [Hyphomonas beringensis]|uniref:5-hmdU DNA kinase helical domain-containing protein n=1 Tax=Hyphomonas beringensis TaxID=1280946 RepID=A0A062U8U5_9PROT|nr:nucleotide kinase domain-containing protein [Hyphomonas beringensis]KCZ54677.1 hypothetical protein HY29_14095 [Hyphomonas beringensis]
MAYDENDLFSSDFGASPITKLRRKKAVRIDGEILDTTPVFDAYWYFACERQRMFRRRLHGSNTSSSSNDPILAHHRFTNAYRASDRVSQYLIRNVIWSDHNRWSVEDLFFRVLLFKIFNRIETWEALTGEFGAIGSSSYKFSEFDRLLSDRQCNGVRNYSAAYIMPSAGHTFGYATKHANHLRLIEWMVEQRFPDKLSNCASMAEAFNLLLSAPSIGPFLAYQFVTDLNYGALTSFSEMEFVIAGPGALDGISKCFQGTHSISAEQVIRHMAEFQNEYFSFYGFEFQDLWGRPLQLIDCQNIFCEISKYSRAAFPEISGRSGRTRIKQKFKPVGRLPAPWYPPSWGVNERISDLLP